MAARVHRIADEAAARLGCTDPFVLCQTRRPSNAISAQALLGESPYAIRLIGPVASLLDDAALLEAWARGATADVTRLATLAAELTADRFGLVAAGGELEAAIRLDVHTETYDCPRALGIRELDHLAELRRRVEAREVPFVRPDAMRAGMPGALGRCTPQRRASERSRCRIANGRTTRRIAKSR